MTSWLRTVYRRASLRGAWDPWVWLVYLQRFGGLP
jgi:hypothetical protein